MQYFVSLIYISLHHSEVFTFFLEIDETSMQDFFIIMIKVFILEDRFQMCIEKNEYQSTRRIPQNIILPLKWHQRVFGVLAIHQAPTKGI